MQNIFLSALVWSGYLLTTVLGHVAMRYAVAAPTSSGFISALAGKWGMVSLGCWVFSTVLWALILSRVSLLHASAIAETRYLLVILAASVVLRESASATQWVGVSFVGLGVLLVQMR